MQLLQLALKSNNSSSATTSLYKKNKNSSGLHTSIEMTNTGSLAKRTFITSHHYRLTDMSSSCSLSDETQKRKELNLSIWKEIYDFFEHYADRSRSMTEIDARLGHVRNKIKIKIEHIQATSFGCIKSGMNRELAACIRSPIEYSSLYERKPYIDQLCYLYWLVEDLINEIGKIESLYPSIEALRAEQPTYADRAFESTIKTLTLWYKLIRQLMNKSDIMGRFLGFAKNKEYETHWTWFEKRLSYSRNEYETVQKWLHENVEASLNNVNNLSAETLASGGGPSRAGATWSEASSSKESSATLTSPTIEVTKPSCSNLAHMADQKIDRQISFALRATTSSVNLLYNNFE